jgi:outer membrane protein TolC
LNRNFRRLLRARSKLAAILLLLYSPDSAQAQTDRIFDLSTRVDLLEAVRSTLTLHPALQSQRAQINISRGLLKQQSGPFDTLLQGSLQQSYENTPLTTPQFQLSNGSTTPTLETSLGSNSTLMSGSASRLFRNGISISPTFQISRETDNLYYPTGINSTNVGLQISIPLLRGRGREVVAARETAARTEVDATTLDLTQTISQLIQNVVLSYWNVVAAQKNVEIAREAEARGKTYVENTQALIAADFVPRNDLNETTANLAQRASARIAAEQALVQAQLQLATDMGINATAMLNNVPSPTDEFPMAGTEASPSERAVAMQQYLREALHNRGDYLAAQLRVQEAQTSQVSAKNGLLPQVNLTVATGYTGIRTGRAIQDFLSSTYVGVERPNAVAGLTYSFPRRNETAEGLLLQAIGSLHQAELQQQQVARDISEGIAVAVANVRNAISRVAEADRSVLFFEDSLSGAREKYRVGVGSIVEMLQVEDKLTAAMQDRVQARLTYAMSITQFRFATGTLFTPTQATQQLDKSIFLTLPAIGQQGTSP